MFSSPWQTNRRPDRNPDGAGNQQWANGDTLGYDAENRVRRVEEPQWQRGLTLTYTYDGDGRRVMKSGTGYPTTAFVYDAFGQLAAKYVEQGAPAVACQTCYLSYDHLVSVRVVTDQNAQVVARHDYLPFGEEILPPDGGRGVGQSGIAMFGAADGVYQRFTGKERDQETGLDFFEARYFGGALGRFTSPDDPFAGQDRFDPQSLNLYSYGLNNPLRYVDPDGHDPEDSSGGVPTFRATGTGYSGLTPLEEWLLRNYLESLSRMAQVSQQTQQFVQPALDWVSRPRNQTCLAASTAAGASMGAAVGMAGVVGGPAVAVTEPTAMLIGGGAGWAGGMISCMSSTNPSATDAGKGGEKGGDTKGTQVTSKTLLERRKGWAHRR